MAQLDLLHSVPHPDAPRKSESAYKTISEVAGEIEVPQHVLRFWESHFPQVKPSRMRGARRYYRPQDVELLKKIKTLLYAKGYTIKGAKLAVKEKDVAEVMPVPVAKPVAKEKKPRPAEDVARLINELRVLKSMLATLL